MMAPEPSSLLRLIAERQYTGNSRRDSGNERVTEKGTSGNERPVPHALSRNL